jgi:hypothetical protein
MLAPVLNQWLVFKALAACHYTHCGVFDKVVKHQGGLDGGEDWVPFKFLKRLNLGMQALKLYNLNVVLVLQPLAFSFQIRNLILKMVLSLDQKLFFCLIRVFLENIF